MSLYLITFEQQRTRHSERKEGNITTGRGLALASSFVELSLKIGRNLEWPQRVSKWVAVAVWTLKFRFDHCSNLNSSLKFIYLLTYLRCSRAPWICSHVRSLLFQGYIGATQCSKTTVEKLLEALFLFSFYNFSFCIINEINNFILCIGDRNLTPFESK